MVRRFSLEAKPGNKEITQRGNVRHIKYQCVVWGKPIRNIYAYIYFVICHSLIIPVTLLFAVITEMSRPVW